MPFCFLPRFRRTQQINPGQGHAFPSDLAAELEDSRKLSMTLLTALLAILAISGSKALHPVVLTLLMYTITLSLATSTCFIRVDTFSRSFSP
ncbi:hypothetical protein JVT61DRAFT_14127 [Boletus reticuloceps]|uniref:Uncharacterized protein n=1 Tax=Boletus reticuloceps TaxID=495285 RepID=A0A8I2YD87_9AGAM|nr:hypothetical protein JVT61DRAFT_14127 [Boletus reticuloceps]